MIRKMKTAVLALTLVLAGSLICSVPVYAGSAVNASEYTNMIYAAIEVLADEWNDVYWDENYPDKEYVLDIRSTRVICLRDDRPEALDEYFGGMEYIIEFLLYDDYMSFGPIRSGQNAGYYGYTGLNNNVVVYRDGRMECASQVLNMYRSKTYESDFSPIIEMVVDFHEQFNQVIYFRNHSIE